MVDIPDYQTLMLPVLRIAAEGDTTIPKAVERLGLEFNLSSDQMAQLLPSGGVPLINNRAHWAKTYLLKAGLLEQPSRGIFRATSKGLELLRAGPAQSTIKHCYNFRNFENLGAETATNLGGRVLRPSPTSRQTLQRLLRWKWRPPTSELRSRRKNWTMRCGMTFSIEYSRLSPSRAERSFFERLVIRLLLAMGYGGGRDESAFHTGGRRVQRH